MSLPYPTRRVFAERTTKKTMRTINKQQYLQFLGVIELAKRQSRILRELETVAAEITGEPNDGYGGYGHISENISDENVDADALLRKMQITVE